MSVRRHPSCLGLPCLIGMNDVVDAGGHLGRVPVGRLTDVLIADSAVDQPRAEVADGGCGGEREAVNHGVRPIGFDAILCEDRTGLLVVGRMMSVEQTAKPECLR